MCGIASVCLSKEETGIDVPTLTKNLLLGIQHRGRDATGVAFRTPRGNIHVAKKDVPASQFISRHYPVGRTARTVILHTRAATQGSPLQNVNNHPVMSGKLVGVHNGMIWNDDYLFNVSGAPRLGQVDSEAIFAALAYGLGEDRKNIVPVLEEIEGTAAITWLNQDGPEGELEVSRISQSPVHWVLSTKGSFLCASEAEGLHKAIDIAGIKVSEEGDLPDGSYLKVQDGQVLESLSFVPSQVWWQKKTPAVREFSSGTWDYANLHNPIRTVTHYGRSLTPAVPLCPTCGLTTVGSEEWATSQCDDCYMEGLSETAIPDESGKFIDPTYTYGIFDSGMFNPDLDIEAVAGVRYSDHYTERTEAFVDWMTETKPKVTGFYHPDARPGDWVITNLLGEEQVGQIYEMPLTFPKGEYIIRLVIENPDREVDETVFITRSYNEFKAWVGGPDGSDR